MGVLFGSRVTDTNVRLRMLIVVFFGTAAFGAILFWKEKLALSNEYIDFPMSNHLKVSQDYLKNN